jgi:hypothetical protein
MITKSVLSQRGYKKQAPIMRRKTILILQRNYIAKRTGGKFEMWVKGNFMEQVDGVDKIQWRWC